MVGFREYAEIARESGRKRSALSTVISFPFVALSAAFRNTILKTLTAARKTESIPSPGQRRFRAETVAENFLKNMYYIQVMCRENNAVFIPALQPVNGIGNRPLTAEDLIVNAHIHNLIEESRSTLDFIRECYLEIQKNSSTLDHFIDLTTVFDNEREQIFSDNCHFSDRGQKIVAEALRDVLLKEERV
jgi:lysophospholipase L1-like esterase